MSRDEVVVLCAINRRLRWSREKWVLLCYKQAAILWPCGSQLCEQAPHGSNVTAERSPICRNELHHTPPGPSGAS